MNGLMRWLHWVELGLSHPYIYFLCSLGRDFLFDDVEPINLAYDWSLVNLGYTPSTRTMYQ